MQAAGAGPTPTAAPIFAQPLPVLSDETFAAILELAAQMSLAPTQHTPPRPPRSPQDIHVTVWDEVMQRKLTGVAAPTEEGLTRFLADNHPRFEIYAGQTPRTPRTPGSSRGSPTHWQANVACCGNDVNDGGGERLET